MYLHDATWVPGIEAFGAGVGHLTTLEDLSVALGR